MSDFLSKFDKDNYANHEKDQADAKTQEQKDKKTSVQQDRQTVKTERTGSAEESFRNHAEEEVEIDLDYRRKQKMRWLFIIIGALLACLLIFFIYQSIVHVEVEDFDGLAISEARDWARENDVEIELEQAYSLDYETNQIMAQSIPAGQKIRKGHTLILTGSLGPDPEEVIPLVGLSELTKAEAEEWIAEHKADNLQIVTEYHDEVDENAFIRLVIRDSNIAAEDYQRRDNAIIYFSSGPEVFEADITVPNFTGMLREQVEGWAVTNDIDITFEEADSDQVEAGHIISQSIAPEELIAQRDEMSVVISLGQAVIVPNFWGVSKEEATMNYPDLAVTVREKYHEKVSFGTLISQSIEADTKLMPDDDKQITVTYSLGRPYLRDFRGQLEGDLPRLFYEEYQSKGADINYTIKFVDSYEVKGTIVEMSQFNEFVPLTYTVEIGISNNALKPTPPEEYPPIPEANTDVEVDESADDSETDHDEMIEK